MLYRIYLAMTRIYSYCRTYSTKHLLTRYATNEIRLISNQLLIITRFSYKNKFRIIQTHLKKCDYSKVNVEYNP